MAKRKLLCEYGALFYKISTAKEISLRTVSNFRNRKHFAHTKSSTKLPCTAYVYTSPVIEELEGVTISMLKDKENNLKIATGMITGLIIKPGETFSFWDVIGDCTKRKGYRSGLILENEKLVKGYGGGLCQLATHIHNLVLGSPLEVVEIHHHSDALFPDAKPHVPYELGVSVLYNYIDYRFQNNTSQNVQLIFGFTAENMVGELRCEGPFPFLYELIEEDHHFAWEGKDCYRNSMIYRKVIQRETGKVINKELIHKLHSKVMYDSVKIPNELIRQK